MIKVGEAVTWQTGDGHTLTGHVLSIKGTGKHATAKVRLLGAIGGATNVRLAKLRRAP